MNSNSKHYLDYTTTELLEMSQSMLDKELLDSIRAGDIKAVKFWHKNHANILTSQENTFLTACKSGNDNNHEIFEYLLENSPKLPLDKMGYVVEFWAQSAEFDKIDNLIDRLGELPVMPPHFFSSLAANANLDALSYFYDKGFTIISPKSKNWELACAAKSGDINTIEFFIDKLDVDINSGDYMAIVEASQAGHLDAVKYLHKRGADLSINNNAAIFAATNIGNLDIVKYLFEQNIDLDKAGKEGAYLLADAARNSKTVFYYLAEEVGLISSDRAKNTALYGAVVTNNLELTKYLIKNGADINADYFLDYIKDNETELKKLSNKFGRIGLYIEPETILGVAVDINAEDIAEILIKNGADISANNYIVFSQIANNGTGTMVNNMSQYQKIEKMLIDAMPEIIYLEPRYDTIKAFFNIVAADELTTKIPPNSIDKAQANTILNGAALQKQWQHVKIIIENYDCDIEQNNNQLLRKAALFGHIPTLELLLEKGADKELLREISPKLLFDITEKQKILEKEKLAQQKQKEQEDKNQKNRKSRHRNLRKFVNRRRF